MVVVVAAARVTVRVVVHACHRRTSFIVFTYTDAHAPTSSHITTRVRLTSQVARSCARNSQAEEQPHRVSTSGFRQLAPRCRPPCGRCGACTGEAWVPTHHNPTTLLPLMPTRPGIRPALAQEAWHMADRIDAHTHHMSCERRTGWLARLTHEGPWACLPPPYSTSLICLT